MDIQVIADQLHLSPPGQLKRQTHGTDRSVLLPLDQRERIHVAAEIRHACVRETQLFLLHVIDPAAAQVEELIVPLQS